MNRGRQNEFSYKVEQAFGGQRPIERETAPLLDGTPPLSALPLLREPGPAGWAQPRIQSTPVAAELANLARMESSQRQDAFEGLRTSGTAARRGGLQDRLRRPATPHDDRRPTAPATDSHGLSIAIKRITGDERSNSGVESDRAVTSRASTRRAHRGSVHRTSLPRFNMDGREEPKAATSRFGGSLAVPALVGSAVLAATGLVFGGSTLGTLCMAIALFVGPGIVLSEYFGFDDLQTKATVAVGSSIAAVAIWAGILQMGRAFTAAVENPAFGAFGLIALLGGLWIAFGRHKDWNIAASAQAVAAKCTPAAATRRTRRTRPGSHPTATSSSRQVGVEPTPVTQVNVRHHDDDRFTGGRRRRFASHAFAAIDGRIHVAEAIAPYVGRRRPESPNVPLVTLAQTSPTIAFGIGPVPEPVARFDVAPQTAPDSLIGQAKHRAGRRSGEPSGPPRESQSGLDWLHEAYGW